MVLGEKFGSDVLGGVLIIVGGGGGDVGRVVRVLSCPIAFTQFLSWVLVGRACMAIGGGALPQAELMVVLPVPGIRRAFLG